MDGTTLILAMVVAVPVLMLVLGANQAVVSILVVADNHADQVISLEAFPYLIAKLWNCTQLEAANQ